MSTFYGAGANPNQPQLSPQNINPPQQQKSNNSSDQETENSQQDIFDRQVLGSKGGRSAFLKEEDTDEGLQEGCCKRCCSCFSLDYYKDFFKVTNKDVTRRIMLNLKFWTGGFFEPLNQ